jgi:hypothetical protein
VITARFLIGGAVEFLADWIAPVVSKTR